MVQRIKRLFTVNKNPSKTRSLALGLNNPTLLSFLFGTSKSGRNVTYDNSLSISALWSATRIIGEAIASLPFEVIEELNNGDIRSAKEHPAYNAINAEPSKAYSSFVFRETLQMHLCIRGNAYALMDRDGNQNVIGLKIVDPRGVNPYVHKGELFYFINGIADPVNSDDIIHLTGFGFDGLKGKSPITVHRENLGLTLHAMDYGSNFFANGAHLSGVLEHPGKLSDPAYQRLKESWKENFAGSENAGETAILEEGVKYSKIGLSPQDALFIETRKFQVEEIARIFRVPLHMLAALERSTFNNVEALSLDFVQNTLRPWVKRWEQEFNRKLFKESEKGRFKVRLNLDGLLRGDTKSRAEYYNTMFMIGALSPNDIRKLEKMNARPGGDSYFTPLNMADNENSNEN